MTVKPKFKKIVRGYITTRAVWSAARTKRNVRERLDADGPSDSYLRFLSVGNEESEACASFLALLDEAFIAPDATLKKTARRRSALLASFREDKGLITTRVPPSANTSDHISDAVICRV